MTCTWSISEATWLVGYIYNNITLHEVSLAAISKGSEYSSRPLEHGELSLSAIFNFWIITADRFKITTGRPLEAGALIIVYCLKYCMLFTKCTLWSVKWKKPISELDRRFIIYILWKCLKKQEAAQKKKSCSKEKKLPEIGKVAQKLPSNLWTVLAVMLRKHIDF